MIQRRRRFLRKRRSRNVRTTIRAPFRQSCAIVLSIGVTRGSALFVASNILGGAVTASEQDFG
jgi:hypothetical protein